MTNRASHQPRNEQESYQPLWDDSLPVPSYMNISLGNSEAPSEASPQQVSEGTASPADKSALEWEPGVYSYTPTLKVTPTPIFGTPDPSLQRMHVQDIPGTRPAPESAMEGPGAATNQRLPEGTVGYIHEMDALYPDGAPTTWKITRGAWLFLAVVVFCNPLIDALILYPFDDQVAGSLFFLGGYPGAGHLRYSGDSLVRLHDYGHQQGVQEILRGEGAALERRGSCRVLVLPRVHRMTRANRKPGRP